METAAAATAVAPQKLSTLPLTTTIDADASSVPSSSSNCSSALGGPALRGFFDAVDSGLRLLEREAAEAEAAAALDEARAHVALVGDGAGAATTATQPPTSTQKQQRSCSSRRAPAPGWAWVADHLLTLVQQYSGGLSEPVMRTSLWQAWRQLPPDGEPTPQLRWTALSTLLESAASDPVPRSATRGADTVRVRLSGIRRGGAGGGGATATGNSSSPPPPPSSSLLEVSDASTRGATCDALAHSALEASGALKEGEGALARAVGGELRMGGVVAWRPTGAKSREEEEEEEEVEEEGNENGGVGKEQNKRRAPSGGGGFVRPFLLPTPAVLLVAPDLPKGSVLAGRGDGAPAKLAPVSAVASSSDSDSSSVVVAAGVVVSVGPLERDFATAAAARAASGVARVVWLSDDFEEGAGKGGGKGGDEKFSPPTALLLLDALSAAGDALCPGEVLLLPGATRVPPPPAGSAAAGNNSAPCALEARPGALLVVVPCSSSPSSSNDADDDDEGLTTSTAAAAAAAARPLSRGGSLRPPFASLRPGVSRVALAGTLVSSSLEAPRGRGARQRQLGVGGGGAAATTAAAGDKKSQDRDLVLTLDDGSGASVELRLPSATAPRSAWAARPGEAVVATATRASVEEAKEEDGESGGGTQKNKKVSFVVAPAGRCAFQSLPRLPALLASPSLVGPGLVPLEAALSELLIPSSEEETAGDGPLPLSRCRCALADAVVAAAPAVAVRRAHSACGRPLRRSALDPSAMEEMMMMMAEDDDGDGEEGEQGGGGGADLFLGASEKKKSGGGGSEPAAAVAVAAPQLPLPTATAGSLVLSVPAPTPGPEKGIGSGSSSAKKNKNRKSQQPPATPAAAAAAGVGSAEAAADDAGLLWTCDFCCVDCSASGVSLSLELDLKLEAGGGGGGKGGRVSTSARVEGAAAASLLGCVPSEFVAWTPKARAARAAALEGRRVHVALVPSSSAAAGGEAIVEIVGVMVLDDDEDEDEDDEEGSGSDGEVVR